jgi:predicted nucleic acid-binding protein
MARYKDLPLGFVDASLIVLAERHQIKRILTLDRRHFNLLQSDRIDYLEVLP